MRSGRTDTGTGEQWGWGEGGPARYAGVGTEFTKTGNAHLQHRVVEAVWAYLHRPSLGATLRKRQGSVSEEVKAIAWKAQHGCMPSMGS